MKAAARRGASMVRLPADYIISHMRSFYGSILAGNML